MPFSTVPFWICGWLPTRLSQPPSVVLGEVYSYPTQYIVPHHPGGGEPHPSENRLLLHQDEGLGEFRGLNSEGQYPRLLFGLGSAYRFAQTGSCSPRESIT